MKVFTAGLACVLLVVATTAAQAGNRYYSLYAPAAPVTAYYAPAYAAPVAPAVVVARRPLLRPFAPPAYFAAPVIAAAPVVAAPAFVPAPIAPISHSSPSYAGPETSYYRGPVALPVTSYYPPATTVYRPIYPAYGPVVYPRW